MLFLPAYHDHVLEKLRRGREDVLAGRLYTTDECRMRLGIGLDERGWKPSGSAEARNYGSLWQKS
jgi:hypothetical protein